MITVVVATKNSGRYLPEALNSLQICRTSIPIEEVLFVDAGSTDQTLDVIAQFGEGRVIKQETSGLYNALNEGVTQARGSHVLFLHSDDTIRAWPSECPTFVSDSVYVGCVDFMRADGTVLFTRFPVRFPRWALRDYPFLFHPNALYPTWALKQFPYNEQRFGRKADRYQIAAMAHLVRFRRLPDFVYQFRIHHSSVTAQALRGRTREPLAYWLWRAWVITLWEDRKLARIARRFRGLRTFQ